MTRFATASCVQAFQAYSINSITAGCCNGLLFIFYSREGCGERKKRRCDLLFRAFCGRAMKEDGDPLDTSPPFLAGLMLETLGNVEEAAVRSFFSSSLFLQHAFRRYTPAANRIRFFSALRALISESSRCW